MIFLRRITATLTAIITVTLLTSCSPDGTGSPTGSSDGLERKDEITRGPDVIPVCMITPQNIFMDDVDMPFLVDCEDMGEAVHTVDFERTNGGGCVVEQNGHVTFASTGHVYSYSAQRQRCTLVGATMTVCSTTLAECVTRALPVPTAIDVRNVQGAEK